MTVCDACKDEEAGVLHVRISCMCRRQGATNGDEAFEGSDFFRWHDFCRNCYDKMRAALLEHGRESQ